jgi:hypothetical protein
MKCDDVALVGKNNPSPAIVLQAASHPTFNQEHLVLGVIKSCFGDYGSECFKALYHAEFAQEYCRGLMGSFT